MNKPPLLFFPVFDLVVIGLLEFLKFAFEVEDRQVVCDQLPVWGMILGCGVFDEGVDVLPIGPGAGGIINDITGAIGCRGRGLRGGRRKEGGSAASQRR